MRRCAARCGRATRQSFHPWGGEEGRMRQFSVAAAALVCAAVVAACGSSDDKSPATQASKTSKLEGAIDVWIMDPGSPKIQGVVKQYGTDFEAAHPGTKVNIQF